MKRIFLSSLFLGYLLGLNAQEVRDVQARVVEDKIQITYRIDRGSFNQTFSATVFVSFDKGATFTGPLKEITGNMGPGLKNGNQTIIWDALREKPFADTLVVFDIRLELDKIRDWMVSSVGNQLTPFGIRIGQLGKLGWYIEGRAGLNSFKSAKFTYTNGEIIDFDQPGYIELNQEDHYSAWSATGGVSFQPVRNLFLYTGFGYGQENYLLGVSEYAYQGDELSGNTRALYKEHSVSGIELDAGVVYRIKKVVLSAGAYSIDFRTIFWTAGIGIVFNGL